MHMRSACAHAQVEIGDGGDDDDEHKRLERSEAEVAALRCQVRTLEAKVMQLTDENTRLRLSRS